MFEHFCSLALQVLGVIQTLVEGDREEDETQSGRISREPAAGGHTVTACLLCRAISDSQETLGFLAEEVRV